MGKNDSDFGAFLAGFVIGGLVGAATALLLAPQSGEETRVVIRDKGIELKEKAAETTGEALHRVDELAHQAMSKADELKNRSQVILEEQKTKLAEQKSKIEEAIAAHKKDGGEAHETIVEVVSEELPAADEA